MSNSDIRSMKYSSRAGKTATWKDALKSQYMGDASYPWSGFNVAASTVSGVDVRIWVGSDQVLDIVAKEDFYLINTDSTPSASAAPTSMSGIVQSGLLLRGNWEQHQIQMQPHPHNWLGFCTRDAVLNEIRIRPMGRNTY